MEFGFGRNGKHWWRRRVDMMCGVEQYVKRTERRQARFSMWMRRYGVGDV